MRKKWNIAICAAVLVAGTMILGGCNEKDNVTDSTNSAVVEEQNTGEAVDQRVTEAQNTEDFSIDTSYVTLHYPKQWEDHVRVEIEEDEENIVQFYVALDDKEEQHMFDILFDSEEGSKIGDIEGTDGETVSVSVMSYAVEMDDWDEEDQHMVYSMMEDVNHIIGKLELEDAFTSAY